MNATYGLVRRFSTLADLFAIGNSRGCSGAGVNYLISRTLLWSLLVVIWALTVPQFGGIAVYYI